MVKIILSDKESEILEQVIDLERKKTPLFNKILVTSENVPGFNGHFKKYYIITNSNELTITILERFFHERARLGGVI